MESVVDIKSNPRVISHDLYDALVYLRIFEGCNLHCDHCFIPNNPKKMSDEMIGGIPKILNDIVGDKGRVLLQWHGGEPTALGKDYIEKALKTIEENKGGMSITHGIQTNLWNYDSSWSNLYKKYFDSSVGVSWDYKIRKDRKTWDNDVFEDKFWKQIELLVSDGLEPYLVVTSTKLFFERYKNPIELFEFLESKGIYRLHIERLTKVGYARDNWDKIGITNMEYSRYMSRFYLAYKAHLKNNENNDAKIIRISPFDGIEDSVKSLNEGKSGGYGCLSGACDSRYHTIDANGYKKGCTALNSEEDNKRVTSDVQVLKFFDLKEERKVRQLTCEGCSFIPICSSGCLATDKFDDSLECSGSKELFKTIDKLIKY